MMCFNHTMIFFKLIFVLISSLEKDDIMIEMCRLKNIVIFLKTNYILLPKSTSCN